MYMLIYILMVILSLTAFILFLFRKISPEIACFWIIIGLSSVAGVVSSVFFCESQIALLIDIVFYPILLFMLSAQIVILAVYAERNNTKLKRIAQIQALSKADNNKEN